MACNRKRSISQYCNDNEQDQDQDEYRTMYTSSGLLHDHPSYHVHNHRDHVQTSGNKIMSINVVAEASNDHQVLSNGTIHNQVQEEGPIGLTLRRSPSLLKKIMFALNQEKQQNNYQDVLSKPQPPPKLPASNFSAVSLQIGSWKRASINAEDLTVKIYYGKKKLVWEFLFGSLKKKIEIDWSNVTAIHVDVDEDKKGRLKIELKERPEYYEEYKFERGRHTLWKSTNDFTEGEADSRRRHTILFSPGVLDEHIKKLLQCDERLFNLSQQPFPIHNSEFFNQDMDFSYHVEKFIQQTSYFVGQSSSNLPMPGLTSPNSNESAKDVSYVNERTNGVWEQSGNNQIQETPLPPVGVDDEFEPYGGVDSIISDLIAKSYHIGNKNLAEVTTEQNCSKVDSTSKPLDQNNQINSNPSGDMMSDGNHHVGQLHIDPAIVVTEENSLLPSTDDLDSSGGVMNHMAYEDDDVCSFAKQQFNDVPAIQEQSSWLSSQPNMHGSNSVDGSSS